MSEASAGAEGLILVADFSLSVSARICFFDCNVSNLAVSDDGSCCYISGCMDVSSINYDSLACFDDGSCVSAVLGCLNSTASNYNSLANIDNWNGGALDNNIGSGSYFTGDQHIIFNRACS